MDNFLLITANVGSLFEENCKIKNSWKQGLLNVINSREAKFIAIHFQEAGGKHFKEYSIHVEPFIKELLSLLPQYSSSYAFLDLEYDIFDKYTALGSLYLIHSSLVNCTKLYNFNTLNFENAQNGKFIYSKNLTSVPYMIREKFPKELWPTIKWGRKGFLHTKWNFRNNVVNLINVHLFHDDSNITSHENPHIYSNNRANALNYVIKYIEDNTSEKESFFLFGDFNFRLNLQTFIDKLIPKTVKKQFPSNYESETNYNDCLDNTNIFTIDSGNSSNSNITETISNVECPPLSAIEFHSEPNLCTPELYTSITRVLRLEKKRFVYRDPQSLIKNWSFYKSDDHEVQNYSYLHEFEITFPPTYPWSEDPESHNKLMPTRPPAWCDRILMNQTAWNSLKNAKNIIYDSIGKDVCMGDHKPVFLCFTI
ncbi:Type I inositol 1,4,5-trisphosphate 5-phosphatase [Strongyloides ratti]|uniref:inositol-polyphosphate 5-phosphatase n=1 Tax=Strongyloides ratti TaxID=34506 RepID=A0A090KYR5_STRRB|nr:Type I inositol 1,4,5-trisphosphate 5-phosphatase [Strongyloides ratti]CEF60364.1 Type I inositol 1,4,5-trisphosphate 5-phosphatase [Strongyloides ratti]